VTTPSQTPPKTPRQSIADTSGGRALLISLAGLAMAMLLPLVGLVFTLFALAVTVRTTAALRKAGSRVGAAVAGIVISLFSLVFALLATATQLYLADEFTAYYTCKRGAGTVSAQQHCVDQLERAIERRVPFLEPGQFELPFVP
jgi:Predicted integral membrane protein